MFKQNLTALNHHFHPLKKQDIASSCLYYWVTVQGCPIQTKCPTLLRHLGWAMSHFYLFQLKNLILFFHRKIIQQKLWKIETMEMAFFGNLITNFLAQISAKRINEWMNEWINLAICYAWLSRFPSSQKTRLIRGTEQLRCRVCDSHPAARDQFFLQ